MLLQHKRLILSESKHAVSIAFGRPPAHKEFFNIEDLEKWFADEREKFAWLQKAMFDEVTHNRNYLEKLWGRVNGWQEAIRKLIEDWKSHSYDEKELEKTINAHKTTLLGGYTT